MEASFTQLSRRAERAFRFTSPSQVVAGRKAIIGPRRLDLLTADADEARRILANGGIPTPIQLAALEQAIRLQRPAPICRRDDLTMLPVEGNWLADAWNQFQPRLKRLQRSVARLDRIDDPNPSMGGGRTSWGTGFLVAADLLLTAAHVVDQLSFSTRVLERGQAVAEFEGYYNSATSEPRDILAVVAVDAVRDLALLRIDPVESDDDTRPVLLREVSQPIPELPICVIGYPLADPRNPAAFVSILFGSNFGVKRAAVGEVLDSSSLMFSHDCSTLGGNSGSPVVDISTGWICGVHVSGQALLRNDAVGAPIAREFLNRFSTTASHSPTSSRRSLMKSGKPNFEEFFLRLRDADADIRAEMDAALDEAAATESTEGGANPFIRETIVLTTGRPVLDIRSGAAVVEFTETESHIWKQRLHEAAPRLAPHIPAVGRIELANHPRGLEWLGTGWLLRDNVVVTNRHVAEVFGEAEGGTFIFRPGFDGSSMRVFIDFLEEFGSSESHEFPLFKIMHIERGGGPDLAFLRIEPITGHELPQPIPLAPRSVQEGEHVAVIGYPARDPFFPDPELMDRIFQHRYDKKRLAPGMVTGKNSERIFHDCSTLGGNSGGEVVSLNTGEAVALHFAGTLFTRNHAVPIDVVAERLDEVLKESCISQPQRVTKAPEVPQLASVANSGPLFVEATIPIKVRVEIGDIVTAASATPSVRPTQPLVLDPEADDDFIETAEARPEDYHDRHGYDANFLGDGVEVPLPTWTGNENDLVTFTLNGETQSVLRYHNFSVVMSKCRRMCRFSACNIDGKKSKRTSRPGWRFDPRIDRGVQIMKECYGNPPKFSRGHMTRREYPAWGTQAEADLGNTDSMHVTNAVPQIQPFNGGIWLALEDYALQNARRDDMRISVFTGPFLDSNDPVRFGVKVPVMFWKVVAFIHDETGKLCATGYTMSQESFIGEEEFIFGRHECNQRPIHQIERRAGMSFGSLADVDPLRDQPESAVMPLLTRVSQIRFV